MKKGDLSFLHAEVASTLRSVMDADISDQHAAVARSLKPTNQLSPAQVHILQEVNRELALEAEGGGFEQDRESYLRALITEVSNRLGFELATFESDQILAQVEREDRIFGVLQPLVDDPKTSDIIVYDFGKVTVQQGRKNLQTEVRFSSPERYVHFVERLLAKAGTSFSTAKPIADGMIGNFARIHAVHSCLCDTGPYLTIRINRCPTVTVSDLVGFGLAPKALLDYLSAVVGAGRTVLVVGEVGTGKTTLVRALASQIAEQESILVIEDTPEIRLQHPHVRYMTTRIANTDGAGRVPPAECIRAGMRMAMNRIIFGEMRDGEAAESFIDVCASGHPGLSTLHARSASEVINRLELFLGRAQRGATREVIYEQISKAVQVVVFVDVCPHTHKRRVVEVREFGSVADRVIRQREIFSYRVKDGAAIWQIKKPK